MTRTKDRAVENAWRLTLGLLTAAAGCGAVYMLYLSFFSGIAGNWAGMGLQAALSLMIGWGVWWLSINRGELVGEW
jgi:hypothetical protein